MRRKFGRRAGMLAATGALAAGVVGMASGTASADAQVPIAASTSHGVGSYADANTNLKLSVPVLWKSDGDWVLANCWATGQTIDNQGDVWYHISAAWTPGGGRLNYAGWVYGAYLDGNAAFHNKALPSCW